MTEGVVLPDVSVVVISFNDSARLPRAIRSIQRQTLRNLEIVVVDDASTDDTESIVGAIAASDPRIRYERLPQNSGGCSAPRNRGVDVARAPWVMFCDSDDEFERHASKNLLEAAERLNADVVCGTAERIDVRTGRTKRWRPDIHEVERVSDGLAGFPELLYDTISVNKVYRRSLLVDNGLRFPEGLLFEDQLFTLEAFASAARIAAIPETVYRWYVDRLSDEPSITQRRHEAHNVDSRVEINRRIDAFLAERGLGDIARIKDLKFLRHDLYLYLSSMLEVDDETAQLLIERLVPYVSSVNLEPAWELRPALRVAIYHLLLGDLEGIRSAMRYVKWASVVEMPIVSSDGREYWGCEHLGAGPDAGGVTAREWLDVTDLHVTLVPFTQRRYLHRLSTLSVQGGVVRATGTTVDFDGSLADVDGPELRFVMGGDRSVATVPAAWTSQDGRLWQWEAAGPAAVLLGRRLTAKDQGTLSLAMSTGQLVNLSNLRAGETQMPRARVTFSGRTEPLGPDSLETFAYGNGAVGWRATRVSTARRRLARAQRAWFRIPGTRRLAILVGLIRRDAVPSLVSRVGGLLPARNLVVMQTDGGRSVTDNTLAIGAHLHAVNPELRQVWVHRGRPELAPDYAEPVDLLTLRHHWVASRARIWIDDGTSPLTLREASHTTAVVVSDGVPVHRVGLDDPSVLVSKAAVRELGKRSLRTAALVTPSRYSSEILRPALSYSGAMLEAGLARLDGGIELRAEDSVAARRHGLGMPTDRSIVIYAPAVRTGGSTDIEPLLDLDRWAEELGTRTYLLLRAPRQQRFEVSTRLRFAIRPLGGELDLSTYLGVADIVISDYSPVIGDAAALDIPTVLFQPDRDIFVNRTRGLYAHSGEPGPIASSTDELLGEVGAWLDDSSAWEARHAPARRAFAVDQCGPADGRSAARAAAAILGLGTTS